ncbi:hypothetical protein OHA25_40140 [Nonomuraea sp. NBC_00507]|uniref:hypothetical protein n=1 Tax=Nonomuraea sp. NBC_00507 TaxID=2976002 RepID=UPI002E17730C
MQADLFAVLPEEGHTFTKIQRRWPDELAAWPAGPSAVRPKGWLVTCDPPFV